MAKMKLNLVTVGLIGLAGYAAYKLLTKKKTGVSGLGWGGGGGGGHHGGHHGGGHGGGGRWRGGGWSGPGWGGGYWGPDYVVADPLIIGTDVPADPQRDAMQACIEIGGTWTADAAGGTCSKA